MAATARGSGSRGSITEYHKALASRKGKPVKNLKKVATLIGTVAINAIPAGRAASIIAKTVARGKATKITSGISINKTKTFTQGKNATVTNTPPKNSGAGPNSPIKGTKTKIIYRTKKISPESQAWNKYGLVTISKSRQGLAAVKAGTAGAYIAGNSAATDAKQKASKKNSAKKKKS
jgi:hypothetical protein